MRRIYMNPKNKEILFILNNGHQDNQPLTRKVRELGVYSELHPKDISIEKIQQLSPKGLIVTGELEDEEQLIALEIPILVIDDNLAQLRKGFSQTVSEDIKQTDH